MPTRKSRISKFRSLCSFIFLIYLISKQNFFKKKKKKKKNLSLLNHRERDLCKTKYSGSSESKIKFHRKGR